tara:strand:- start:3272 stop:3736 length:465 start_codon:yes stop_codon:yes gene_type:complete
MNIKNVIAAFLLLFSVFGNGFMDWFDFIPRPEPENVSILNVEKPSQEVKDKVMFFSDLVTDPSDRAKIAIFNYEFAKRVLAWDANVQQVNDVYSLAGKTFFENTLVNKYEGLAEEIVSLLDSLLTSENHVVSDEEKLKLNQYFMGSAWVLIQKG